MTYNEAICRFTNEAEKRKIDILSYRSKISENVKNGNVYYVSDLGDDAKDGKSEASPIKTLERVNSLNLVPGDTVLFRCGGIYRGILNAMEGVTYSSYGEGEKPKLYGSDMNFQSAEWEETEQKDIYCLSYNFTGDVGLIVFNGGGEHSYKYIPEVDGFGGSLEEIKKDLGFYHDLQTNKLYLRSERKNPSIRFPSIEIGMHRHCVQLLGDNITIDNLEVAYTGAHGIAGLNVNGLTVQNCYLHWIGGSIQGHNPHTRYGNGVEIYVGCRDFVVKNCIFSQIYDAAITHQFKGINDRAVIMENVRYEDNVIEYCTYSIEYFLGCYRKYEKENIMRNILYKNNICLYAGCGWGDQREDYYSPAHIKGWEHPNQSENFVIEDNIFAFSRYYMVDGSCDAEKSVPLFKNNVLVQTRNGLFGGIGYKATPTKSFMDIVNAGFGENELITSD